MEWTNRSRHCWSFSLQPPGHRSSLLAAQRSHISPASRNLSALQKFGGSLPLRAGSRRHRTAQPRLGSAVKALKLPRFTRRPSLALTAFTAKVSALRADHPASLFDGGGGGAARRWGCRRGLENSPRSAFGASPLRGGDASGPAKPDPRRLWMAWLAILQGP